MPKRLQLPLVVLVLALAAGSARAAEDALTDLSIEDLMNEPVTLVAKKETPLFRSPAAIAVVTQEDIRRLGVASIPEALRLVTGMDVARINSHSYAISARGFEGQYSDKLLVMIDGRTIYEPTFAGVHWASQDLMMEDLDRIEVIRGPGATLWGANAVNGVVNIITKPAAETQGTLLSASLGTGDQAAASFRYGGRTAGDLYYRGYLNYSSSDGLETANGGDAPDRTRAVRGGFRMDRVATDDDHFTVQGDVYASTTREGVRDVLLVPPYSANLITASDHDGANLLGRWTHKSAEGSELTVQSYYAHAQFGQGLASDATDTFDIEMQHRFQRGARNEVVWGAGYRSIADHWNSSGPTQIVPATSTTRLVTAFLQDEINLTAERLRLTLGSKFSYDRLVGFEVQPGARLLWALAEDQTVWASIARAIRTPDRFERGGYAEARAIPGGPGDPPTLVIAVGNPDIQAEELIAYELGYRVRPTPRSSIDVTAFYNVYDKVVDYLPAAPVFEATPAPPHLLFPQIAQNVSRGASYGAEAELQWSVTDRWRLTAGYSWLHLRFLTDGRGFDSPEQQVHVRSYLNLRRNIELAGAISYVDRLQTQGIPSYVRLDLGGTLHATRSLEIGVWGQNLLDRRHEEFRSVTTNPVTQIPRTVVLKLTWSF